MVAARLRIAFCAPCDMGGSTGRKTSWRRSVSLAGSLSARAAVGATSRAASAAATSMRRSFGTSGSEITRLADRRLGYQEHVRLTSVIAKLEPGGTQLGALRKLLALREHGFESHVIAGEATAPGIGLFTGHGIGVEVWGRCSGMQYACRSDFADWLRPRLARADLVHAHMFGAWWAAARAIPTGVPLVGSEHNAFQWPGRPRR